MSNPVAAFEQAPPPPAATNGDGRAKIKRVRMSNRKVKTGCSNCKKRRIKCDEKRPICTHCVRSRKDDCEYPPPNRRHRPNEVVNILPKLGIGAPPVQQQPFLRAKDVIQLPPRRHRVVKQNNTPPQTPVASTSVVLYRPSVMPFDRHEVQYFQLFREQTASELSGFFDSVFWTRSVLQEAHAEGAIRHSVVALGALYKTLEKSSETPPGSPSDSFDPVDNAYLHWEVAVKQYSQAIQALYTVKDQDLRSHRTRLMASVLLACFDSFIGDHKQAITQIQSGLQLLEQLLPVRGDNAFQPTSAEPVEEELLQIFTRLAIQAKSWDMAFHFPHPFVIRLTPQSPGSSPQSEASSPSPAHPSIPDRFASLIEARVAWDKLCERIFRFTETMFSYTQGPMGLLPPSLLQYGMSFQHEIEAWATAFEPILARRHAPGIASQEKAGIAVLKMFQIMGMILYKMTFVHNELQFDDFLPEFQAIVDLALEVVGDEEKRAAARRCPVTCRHQGHGPAGHDWATRHIKPSFSADMGIVPPLYVVATKCRDPTIRRQAIRLLRSSARREAMWDSELAARIAIWITEVEEQQQPQQPLSHFQSHHYQQAVNGGAYQVDPASPAPINGRASSVLSTVTASTMAASPPRWGGSDFGDATPLGPGGNARWEAGERLESYVAAPVQQPSPPPSFSSPIGNGGGVTAAMVAPEERRVMVRSVEFDLRERVANLSIGTRGLQKGMVDPKRRTKRITW